MITSLSHEELQTLLQSAGYRVEIVTDEQGSQQLRSATAGVTFGIRAGNPAPEPGRFLDYVSYAALNLDGPLDEEIINGWNTIRRFARLHRNQNLLILEMDVSVLEGVTEEHLKAMTEIWDRLVQDLLGYLRECLTARPAAG